MIYTNSDVQIQIAIEDGKCEPFSLVVIEGIEVYLYQKRDNVLQQYATSDVTIVNAAEGIIRVQFDRANNQNISNADLLAEIAVSITDADSQNNIAILRISDLFISKVTVSV